MKLKLTVGISLVLVMAVAVRTASRRSHHLAGPSKSAGLSNPPARPANAGSNPKQDPRPTMAAPLEQRADSSSPGADPHRINLKKLREAVHSGNYKAVEAVGGSLEPEDADAIFALLFEIPTTGTDGADFKLTLVNLLHKTPGEAALKHMLWMVKEPEFLLKGDWNLTVIVLGQRKYREAAPFLESVALPSGEFPQSPTAQTRVYSGAMALLQLDSASYLPRITMQVRTLPEDALFPYVTALSYSAEAGVDIGLAVPDLQLRFTALTQQRWGARSWIAQALENYSNSGKSEPTKSWLIRELRRLIDSDQVEQGTERSTYVKMLKRLEEP